MSTTESGSDTDDAVRAMRLVMPRLVDGAGVGSDHRSPSASADARAVPSRRRSRNIPTTR